MLDVILNEILRIIGFGGQREKHQKGDHGCAAHKSYACPNGVHGAAPHPPFPANYTRKILARSKAKARPPPI